MIRKFYSLLERYSPGFLKSLIPQRWRIQLGYQIKTSPRQRQLQSLLAHRVPALALPPGETEASLKAFLSGFYIKEDGPSPERRVYLEESLKRFLYTLQIIPIHPGRLLEIGANPYFISLLLKKFTPYELSFVNFFGRGFGARAVQTLVNPEQTEIPIPFDNVNVEEDRLPYESGSFDVVLLCEVLEHFTNDPCKALLELKRVLKPEGILILTTPNVARLENFVRMWDGHNFYDPYSGHGPYGRHNREYTVQELNRLLAYLGFSVEEVFTADVHSCPDYPAFLSPQVLKSFLENRPDDWGQYSFVRAINTGEAGLKKPAWLYRSYPDGILSD